MSHQNGQIPWIDASTINNWRNFPRDELAKYAGLYVAYSWDGKSIVASAEAEFLLNQRILAAGLDSGQVIVGYVDQDDTRMVP